MSERVSVVEAIEYAQVDGQSLLLDLHLPRRPGQHPVTLWVHGGAWLYGDRTTGVGPPAGGLAERGVAVASIDYRLGPAGAFPRSIEDVRAAVRWLRRHGRGHGLATERIGAWGASAGGHLSLMAALADADPDRIDADRIDADRIDADRIDAVVDCFGPTDLPARIARTELERRILPAPPDIAYLSTDPEEPDLAMARAASPLHQDLRRAPPVLIVHGDRDQQMALDQSVRMHQALVAAGRESTLLVLGGAGHEDARFHSAWVLDAVAAFLRRHLA